MLSYDEHYDLLNRTAAIVEGELAEGQSGLDFESSASAIRTIAERLRTQRQFRLWAMRAGIGFGAHAVFWILLLVSYKRSPRIRSCFPAWRWQALTLGFEMASYRKRPGTDFSPPMMWWA